MKASKIKCPTCGKQGDWFAGACGPFCSRRCKLVDLGKWFGEEHVISNPLRPEHLGEEAPGNDTDEKEQEDEGGQAGSV